MPRFPAVILVALAVTTALQARTRQELADEFQQLPSVAEPDLPPFPNKPLPFRGALTREDFEGSTWVTYPFVENPGSFAFDPQGRLYVAETHRMWMGVPDLRGASELVRGDFQSVTLEDRTRLYETWKDRFPEGWFTANSDRIVRLEDRDRNGAADHRTIFADGFNDPLDGVGFSLLAEDGENVYFTCIPHVWKLRDEDGDGVAESRTPIATGFGARVSFIGHDLHGIIQGPDGMLYFSVGDRGYHFTGDDGKVSSGPGRGAIFRCEPDGSRLEVYCTGLRNPQELVFDDHGNLFTFDNTGDIGDLARMVYALDNTDSGWDMAHQSAHHYLEVLDWGEFHPAASMWVAEKMFETHTPDQPQWVYPPMAHVARGPSGATWLTGESLPEDLRGKFILCNYRGAPTNSSILTVGIEPKGGGFAVTSETDLVTGIAASDVELGFDGRIYICDWGGGWSVNRTGSIQVLTPLDEAARQIGDEIAALFAEGFDRFSVEVLIELLDHRDRRVRQRAQFTLVDRGSEGRRALLSRVNDTKAATFSRLHALWGLGQLARGGEDLSDTFISLLQDKDPAVRENAIRTSGDLALQPARASLLLLLKQPSDRDRTLAAVALGRICEPGDTEAISALYELAKNNGYGNNDIVLRHAILSALDRIGTVAAVQERTQSWSEEEKRTAILFLRRHQDSALASFLDDTVESLRHETIRAIYDTAALDSEAGDALAALGPKAAALPETLQLRVIAANFRRATPENAQTLLQIAASDAFPTSMRRLALVALRRWETPPQTDPVMGTYRPHPVPERSFADLREPLRAELIAFLGDDREPELMALALRLASECGIELDDAILRAHLANAKLGSDVRIATLESMVDRLQSRQIELVASLLDDPDPEVRATALTQAFQLGMDALTERATTAISEDALPVARAAMQGLALRDAPALAALWTNRDPALRPALWLDAWLALNESPDPAARTAAATFAASSPHAVFELSVAGGDPARGETVYRNQGACLQCHKIGPEGGEQGPPLTQVGDRLDRAAILQSIYDPNAVISPGYGLSTVSLTDGAMLMGRVARETPESFEVIGLDGSVTPVKRASVAAVSPPVSAMPPIASALPPRDLRDLVAYLAAQKGGKNSAPKSNDQSHGETGDKAEATTR